MASSLLDVCRFTPTAGGTTDWTYSAAVTGYQSPTAASVVNGAIYSYRAESADLVQWEIGTGAYNTGTGVLARTTVLFNSSGTTAKISFSAVPQVAIVALAEDLFTKLATATNNNAPAGNVGEYFSTGTGNNNGSSTVTITIASPAVVSWTGHGFTVGAATTAVMTTTTGALPTGVTSGTTYYAKAIDANTFNIATTADNALAGTFINTSGTQSGTHTMDVRVTMANNTSQNLAAFTLQPGDWEVASQCLTAAIDVTTTVTSVSGNLATTSASIDRAWGRRLSLELSSNTQTIGNSEFIVFNIGPARFSLATATKIYCVGTNTFGTSGMISSGWLRARRPW